MTEFDHYIPMLLRGEMQIKDVPLYGREGTVAFEFFLDLFQAMIDEHRASMVAASE